MAAGLLWRATAACSERRDSRRRAYYRAIHMPRGVTSWRRLLVEVPHLLRRLAWPVAGAPPSPKYTVDLLLPVF